MDWSTFAGPPSFFASALMLAMVWLSEAAGRPAATRIVSNTVRKTVFIFIIKSLGRGPEDGWFFPTTQLHSAICATASFRHRSFAAMAGGVSSLEKRPAALSYRMPAEWEPHAATWLSWPRREGVSFPGPFDRVMPTLRQMVEALLASEP